MPTPCWRENAAYVRTGPVLNAWSMRVVGWLKDERVARVSTTQDVVLRPLHRPALDGFLAAEVGPFLVEYRIPDTWDSGVSKPCVLVHGFEEGETYLMTATDSGQQELVVGDRVGCGRSIEVEVLRLDDATATVRLTQRDLRVTRPLAEPRT